VRAFRSLWGWWPAVLPSQGSLSVSAETPPPLQSRRGTSTLARLPRRSRSVIQLYRAGAVCRGSRDIGIPDRSHPGMSEHPGREPFRTFSGDHSRTSHQGRRHEREGDSRSPSNGRELLRKLAGIGGCQRSFPMRPVSGTLEAYPSNAAQRLRIAATPVELGLARACQRCVRCGNR
jgi:hypothetical protein